MFPTASDALVSQIKVFEGFRSKAYSDPLKPGLWTIGYGTSIGVKPGDVISESNATVRLVTDLAELQRLLSKALTVRLGNSQADALYSLVYNVGIGAFTRSKLCRKLNSNDASAPNEFLDWDHDAVGHEVIGLKRRRQWEHEQFVSEPWPVTA